MVQDETALAGSTDPGASGRTRPATPLLGDRVTDAHTSEAISDAVLRRRPPRSWYLAMAISFAGVTVLLFAITYLLAEGVGIWGLNIPVAWGFAIVNFVWWIGIGHAGTLISAILFLFRSDWRASISRFAEAMTLFAIACAALFPLLHLGRPEVFYWLIPYPNTLDVWPQFRSPLVWDFFAVLTYATVSLIFWYLGLIPDLATMRDRARGPIAKKLYGLLAWGWRGSVGQWKQHGTAYLLLAGLATPLVISVHSIVGLDFAVTQLPGWHTTIFPPYFVAGAIFSGFAMVLTMVIPIRAVYGLREFITDRHLDYMGRIMLATGLLVAYGYLIEHFETWVYGGSEFHRTLMSDRMTGRYAGIYWTMVVCNVLIPQLLWSGRIRNHPLALFLISIAVNVGMWVERYVIVVTSLHRDFLPSAWEMYAGTIWDWATFVGSLGLFAALLFLFVRVLPMISMFEVRELFHGHTDS